MRIIPFISSLWRRPEHQAIINTAYPIYDTVHRIGYTSKINKVYLTIDIYN